MKRRVFTAGETVYDILLKTDRNRLPSPVSANPGGAMLNTSVTLGRLGHGVFFMSELGTDRVGNIIEAFLRENGVDSSLSEKYDAGMSPLALAFLDENSNAEYSFYRIFPDKRMSKRAPALKQDDIIIFGSFFATAAEIRPFITDLLAKAEASESLIIYDPNFREAHRHELPELMPRIESNISASDIVRASDEDMKNIFGASTAEDAYRAISSFGRTALIYTSGGRDVQLLYGDTRAAIDVPSIDAVSTVGAGDTFNAGIIHSLIRHDIVKNSLSDVNSETWTQILATAAAFSAEVCMSYDNYISRDFARQFI